MEPFGLLIMMWCSFSPHVGTAPACLTAAELRAAEDLLCIAMREHGDVSALEQAIDRATAARADGALLDEARAFLEERREAEAALRGAMVAGASMGAKESSENAQPPDKPSDQPPNQSPEQSSEQSPDAVVAWLVTCLERAERAGVIPSLIDDARSTLHDAREAAAAWREAEEGLLAALGVMEAAVARVVGGEVSGDTEAASLVNGEVQPFGSAPGVSTTAAAPGVHSAVSPATPPSTDDDAPIVAALEQLTLRLGLARSRGVVPATLASATAVLEEKQRFLQEKREATAALRDALEPSAAL